MSKSIKKPNILPVDQAFDHLLNKSWIDQSTDFRTKYKSCRSKYKAGDLKVSTDKKKEMLLEAEGGYKVNTELTFICPSVD